VSPPTAQLWPSGPAARRAARVPLTNGRGSVADGFAAVRLACGAHPLAEILNANAVAPGPAEPTSATEYAEPTSASEYAEPTSASEYAEPTSASEYAEHTEPTSLTEQPGPVTVEAVLDALYDRLSFEFLRSYGTLEG
jgi:hypothetical protein